MLFQSWDKLLHRYVDEQGLVNYQALMQSDEITHCLQKLTQLDPEQLSTNQRLAFWLNLYNALTIERVLKNYPIQSILPKFLGIPNWIAFWAFFSRPACKVGRDRYSLNNIEHKILRRQFNEPRIHFALVCASIGCPLLRNEAYTGDRVSTQLDEDANRFINNLDKVDYDLDEQVLYCSKIFKWYKKDFLQVANSIPEYIQTYLASDLSLDASTPIKYLDYDWHLNQRISS